MYNYDYNHNWKSPYPAPPSPRNPPTGHPQNHKNKPTHNHRRTWPVSSRGPGAEVSRPIIFSSACPKNQVVLPEYYLPFLPGNGHLINSRGKGDCNPLVPRLLRLCWLQVLSKYFLKRALSYLFCYTPQNIMGW